MSIKLETPPVKGVQQVVNKAGLVVSHSIRQGLEEFFLFPRSNKTAQILLSMQYREMLELNLPLPSFEDVEFRAYSQFGEDGILLYLFSLLGTTNKRCVEICGGGGYDNTANLIINHGWKGLFFDGDEQYLRKGQQFYLRCADTKMWPPELVQSWITAENINTLLEQHGYTGEIDLLSLDMDGVDYWIWKAIECIQPRIVVLEYNTSLGPELSVTVPYRPSFVVHANSIPVLLAHGKRVVNTFVSKPIADRIDKYYGASLTAFTRLGKRKGYRLIGCERYGYNAFFLRSDLGTELFPEKTPTECFEHPFAQYSSKDHKHTRATGDWIEVE